MDEIKNYRGYYKNRENITYIPVVDSGCKHKEDLCKSLDDAGINKLRYYPFNNNFGQRKTHFLHKLQSIGCKGWVFFLDGDEHLSLDSLSHLSGSLPTHIDFSSPFCIAIPRNNIIKGVGPRDLKVLNSLKEVGGGNEDYDERSVLPEEMREHNLHQWMWPDIQPRLMRIEFTDHIIGVTHEMPVAKGCEDHKRCVDPGISVDFFPVIQHRKTLAEQERMDRYHRDLLKNEEKETKA